MAVPRTWHYSTGMGNRTLLATVSVAVVVLGAACSNGSSGSPLDEVSASSSTVAAPTPSVQASISFDPGFAGPVPGTPLENPFGTPIMYTNNFRITVKKPIRFVPGEYAAGVKKGDRTAKLIVVAKNMSTNERLDTSWIKINASAGSSACERVFDSDILLPDIRLSPGQSVRYPVAFACRAKKGAALTVEVNPGEQYYGDIEEFGYWVGEMP